MIEDGRSENERRWMDLNQGFRATLRVPAGTAQFGASSESLHCRPLGAFERGELGRELGRLLLREEVAAIGILHHAPTRVLLSPTA